MPRTFFKMPVLSFAAVVAASQASCSAKVRYYPPDDTWMGGSSATGGMSSAAGGSSTGGIAATAPVSTGGAPTGGTTAAATGGTASGSATGGVATGGVVATSSASVYSGGAVPTGGAIATGGAATGGKPSTGGFAATSAGGSGTNACGSSAGTTVCGSVCCTSDQFCISDSSCGPKAGPGSTCPYGNAQCTTDSCVAGFCCKSASCGFGETCATGSCACSAGAAKVCNSCAVWDFEWGKVATPWVNEICPNWASANGTTGIQISSSVFHPGTGSHSLVADINVELGTSVQAEIAVALPCAANLGGYGFSFWLYVAGPELPNWNDGLNIDTWSGSTFGETVPTVVGGVPTGQWFFVNEAIPISATTPVDRIGIRLVPSMSWTGQMYVDDFVLTAPKS